MHSKNLNGEDRLMSSPPGGTHLKAGMMLSLVLASLHAVWAALVAIGWGQAVLDFLFWLHMLGPAWKVQPFEPAAALFLILATGTIGFVMGSLASVFWHLMSAKPDTML